MQRATPHGKKTNRGDNRAKCGGSVQASFRLGMEHCKSKATFARNPPSSHRGCAMRKSLTALATAATIAVAAVAAPTAAEARRGWWIGPAIGGFAAAAIVGSAFARPYYGYGGYYGGYNGGYYPAYYAGPTYYSYYAPQPAYYDYYYAPRPYYNCWRWRYGYRYRVC
jgi:hypothetical protein